MRVPATILHASPDDGGSAGCHAGFLDWGPTMKCFDPQSPPIEVSGVPQGTAKLDIRMIDLDMPSYPHGGATVAWSGESSLPYGAFRYRGPCPPSPHTYEFTVKALDARADAGDGEGAQALSVIVPQPLPAAACSAITARKVWPYRSSFAWPTPDTSRHRRSVAGRADAISSSVRSWKMT